METLRENAMLVGVTLIKSSTAYYSPAFGRGGEKGLFAVDCLNLEGTATLDIDIEHKNREDTSWTTAETFAQIGAVEFSSREVSALKEQLRLKYTVGGASPSSFVHFFVYAPTWK
jgi:hypothetical protein